MTFLASLTGLYAACGVAGFVFSLLGLPLPWMIGPLICAGLLTASGTLAVRVPAQTRPFGQVTVATFVGAHFTPEALHALTETAPLLLAASLYIVAVTLVVSMVQRRLFGTDGVTAFLSVVPTSPVEAGVLAEQHGVASGPVIVAQTLRIALVVTLFPLLLAVTGDVGVPLPPPEVDHGATALAVTLAGAVAGPVLCKLLRLNNPFFFGPLFMAAALSSLGQPVFDIPAPILALAQIVLGTWLGSRFTRETLFGRRGFLPSILFSSGLLLVLCLLGAWLASRLAGEDLPTMALGFAPGGTTEMALTAGILGQDVALVTAMHIARIFVIMPNLHWLTRLGSRTRRRSGKP